MCQFCAKGFEESRIFLDKLTDMVEFLLSPQYIKEGKNRLVISIGMQ